MYFSSLSGTSDTMEETDSHTDSDKIQLVVFFIVLKLLVN